MMYVRITGIYLCCFASDNGKRREKVPYMGYYLHTAEK